MLAGRDIGMFVGVLTMGATWVGGGFINGSAQEAYKSGLVWTQVQDYSIQVRYRTKGYKSGLVWTQVQDYSIQVRYRTIAYKSGTGL